MDGYQAERHERNSSERRNQLGYKHTMAHEDETDWRPTKRATRIDSDDKSPFGPRDKNHFTVKLENHSENRRGSFVGKSRPKPWEKLNIQNTSVRRTQSVLTPIRSYPRYSEFSGMVSAGLFPEKVSPGWTKNKREVKRFFSEKAGLHDVDSDGDILMTDADSEEAVTECSGLSEVDKRLTELEFAKKSSDIEAKEFKAKLSKSMRRLEALEDFAESKYRLSRRRQMVRWSEKSVGSARQR